MRELRPPARPILGYRGSRLGDVLSALEASHRNHKRRIDACLGSIVPEVVGIDSYAVGNYVTVALKAAIDENGQEISFGPEAISDGTIRVAGVLAALFQPFVLRGGISLVGIEEPGMALHPAAAGVLFDALTEASERVQVLATTQHADLLDREDLDVSSVRAVGMSGGLTTIGEIDEVSKRIVRENLCTVGELMRSNQLSSQRAADGESAPKGSSGVSSLKKGRSRKLRCVAVRSTC